MWWQWLCEPLRELEREAAWPECRAAFLARLGLVEPEQHPVVEELLRQLDELPDDARNAELAPCPLDRRTYAIIERLAQAGVADQPEPVDPPVFDEAGWTALLTECGPHWDATEEGWSPFVAWFCHQADERGLGVPARDLIDHLTALPVTDRILVMTDYGIVLYPRWFADVDADLVRADPELAEVALHTRLCRAVARRDRAAR